MLPLDQGRLVTHVIPDRVRETVSLTRIDARHSGLLLDCLEEFVLVDLAIKLPEHLLALVVTWLRRTIARYLIEFIVLIWRNEQVFLLEVDVLLHKDSWAGRLKVRTSFRISRQFEKIDL